MKPYPLLGIGVFVFKNSQFLMGMRQNSHGHGSWSIPGGHLEFGENWEETARREVEEEVGLGISNVRFGAVTNDIFPDENKHYVTIWMLSQWEHGEPRILEPNKFIKLEWRTFDNLPEPLFLPWTQLLKSEFVDRIKAECADS